MNRTKKYVNSVIILGLIYANAIIYSQFLVKGFPQKTLVQKLAHSIAVVRTDTGLGSGVLVSKTGLIITNRHVIEGREKIGVEIGGKVYIGEQVQVVFQHPTLDLAYLKINLPIPAEFVPKTKKYGEYQRGDEIYSIGNPLGNYRFISKGIISKFHYYGAVDIGFDSTALFGSSGGGLFTTDGELIGVVSSTFMRGDHYTGMHRAISSREFLKITEYLISIGY